MPQSNFEIEESMMVAGESIIASILRTGSGTETGDYNWYVVPNDSSVQPFSLYKIDEKGEVRHHDESKASAESESNILKHLAASEYFTEDYRNEHGPVFLVHKPDGSVSIVDDRESIQTGETGDLELAELQRELVNRIVIGYNSFTTISLCQAAMLRRSPSDLTTIKVWIMEVMIPVDAQTWINTGQLDKLVYAIACPPRTRCFDWKTIINEVVEELRKRSLSTA